MEVVFTFVDYDLTLCTFFRYCDGKNIYRIKKRAFSRFRNGCSWVVGGVEDEQLGGQQRGCQVAWVLAAGLKLDPWTALRAQGWSCGGRYSPASQQLAHEVARTRPHRVPRWHDSPMRTGQPGWHRGATARREVSDRRRRMMPGCSKVDAAGGEARALQVQNHGSRKSWKLGFVIDTSTMLSRLSSFSSFSTFEDRIIFGFLLTLQRSCQYLPLTSCQSCKNEPLENLVGLNFFWIPPTVRIRNCCSLLVCRSLVLVLPFPYCWPPAGLEEFWSWF